MKLLGIALSLFFVVHVLHAEDTSDYPGVKGSDQEIAQKLTGTWTGKKMGFRATLIYKSDGTCSSSLDPEDFFVKVVADPYSFTGKWEIKGGILLTTVTKSSSEAIKVGTRYKDQPLELTKRTFVTKNEKDMITTFTRVKQTD